MTKMKNIIILSLLVFFALSCRKKDSEIFDGPSLNDLYGPFAILKEFSFNTKEIDFAKDGNLVVNGELSKNTNWVIKFTGSKSGALRTITGTDRVISEENAAWEGGANSFPAFGLEKVYVDISFPDEIGSPTVKDSITVTGLKIDKGIFVTGFEDGLGTKWTRFNQATVNGRITCGTNEAAKGTCYYGWNGRVGWDWAIGSVNIKPESGNFGLPASATNLFFNMGVNFMENTGSDNSFILFWFDEDENGDGVFDPSKEDRYIYQYWYKKDGWDLVSLNYNDLQFDAEGNKIELFGNGLPEPSKLFAINVFYLANPANGNSKAYVDHIIFTTNEPYRP
jgi:hypothetical protein